MIPINKRKKKVPSNVWIANYTREPAIEVNPLKTVDMVVDLRNVEIPKHKLRKMELSMLHGIPVNDIFVDQGNGVELYKTPTGWATRPESWRGVIG